jgi:hypothetical protein
MDTIRLILWNAAEAAKHAERLQACGYQVDSTPLDGPAGLRQLRDAPPSAVVIDLSRLPSQGRDIGVALRKFKSTRLVPLVFVAGDEQKVARVRQLLPEATYTSWGRIRSALKQAIRCPPTDPVVPTSVMAAYSHTPLPTKLGIKTNSVVLLIGAPPKFEETLSPLPPGVKLRKEARGPCDLVLWFTKSRKDLERRIQRLGMLAGKGGLWIAWPKKASGEPTDLTQPLVRRIGLDAGLVDFKVCSVDPVWTGLRFVPRKKERPSS